MNLWILVIQNVDEDWTGTDRYRDNQGNTMSCKTDWTGAYVCDQY